MTDIMAAIGRVQLKRYPKLLERRREIIHRYYVALKNADCSPIEHYSEDYNSSMHLFLVRISSCDEQKRNEIFKKLAENGIACSVHYKPLPMMTAYKKLGFNIKDYPNAFAQYQNEITLPLNTMLSNDDVDYIIENFLSIIK
ncbi:UDP-4-amino-4-deoxy-L-arabinose--oxoglutarate aminotransferase [bioreactor metagenome]|uniref:UDP-4-amino-4-deoxy-L-arabinose--oxoglutarate aminotransferase n=1 Tax=bioreactor metagenome TaxID=1076179 RepID=A0A645CML1_9ZZZZ